jgi:hypothetical protein
MKIEEICEYYGIQNYTINDDGTIDVDGNVDLNDRSLTKLPLKFNKVTGYFSCSVNKLTSLEGCPIWVGGRFHCWDNRLTSLEGCPSYVGGYFYCLQNPPLPKEIMDNPKAEILRLQREAKLNTLLNSF